MLLVQVYRFHCTGTRIEGQQIRYVNLVNLPCPLIKPVKLVP